MLYALTCFCQTKSQKSRVKDSVFLSRGNLVPILAFDNDNGFRFGGTINIYRIKRSEINAERRPFTDNLFLRGFHSTKKNFQSVVLLESNTLIRKSKCFIELSASKDDSFEFFGINGYQSLYNEQLIDPEHPNFISKQFFKHKKEFYKFRFDHQQFLRSPYFRLLNGLSILYTKTDFDSSQLIYDYTAKNLLKSGNGFLQYNLGLVAENRNNQFYCTKGYWHEAMLIGSTDLSKQHFIKSILTFRNYIPVKSRKTILMSRLSFQNKLYGETPYELLSQYFDSRLTSDGIGGIFTLRGKPRNRMLADGFILSNLELKRSILQRPMRSNVVSLELSFFIDQFFITQEIKIKDKALVPFYDNSGSRYAATCGIGGYIVLNESSAITFNYGFPILKNEHGGRLYIGAGFMF